MKTRIIHTKIYDDDWFNSLTPEQKLLFIYLFTNSRIGQSGIYQISDRVIIFETGLKPEALKKAKEVFEKDKKVFFFNGWVYIVKAALYGGYTGSKNEVALKSELENIPYEIKKYFNDRVLIGYRYSSDTSINHKSKIINNKSEIEEKVVKKEEEEIQKNDGENSLASILRERFSKPAKPNSHISTSWQDKAFRYAQSLKIDLTDPNLKSRWLKVFKLAAEGRKAKNLELAYSYLSDYPRPLSSKAKAQYFFWLYENGLPVDKKAGFINLKILFALFVASFLFFLLPFFSNKRTGSVDSDLPRNLKKIEVLRPTPSVPPLSKKSVEDLICEKFGPDCNVAIAVAKAESGLRCDAVSQTNDHGVFQINAVHLPKFNGKSPYDCEANIEVAYQIYKSWGGFRPWTAYTSGRYLKFLKKGGNNYAGSHL